VDGKDAEEDSAMSERPNEKREQELDDENPDEENGQQEAYQEMYRNRRNRHDRIIVPLLSNGQREKKGWNL
jgi:hypothetical protein